VAAPQRKLDFPISLDESGSYDVRNDHPDTLVWTGLDSGGNSLWEYFQCYFEGSAWSAYGPEWGRVGGIRMPMYPDPYMDQSTLGYWSSCREDYDDMSWVETECSRAMAGDYSLSCGYDEARLYCFQQP
jgi:hypothetical protein